VRILLVSEEEKHKASLIPHTPQQLSVRASLVTRGLEHLIHHRIPVVAWSRPSLVGTLSSPYEMDDSADPEKKFIYFNSQLRNVSKSFQNVNEGVGILRRSRTTGEIASVPGDGFGFPASRVLVPPESFSPEILVGLSFRREEPLGKCLKKLFQESCELLAYDEQYGTVIAISLDQPGLVGLPDSGDHKGIRILEVDDEEPVRTIIRDMLVSVGYECTSVPNGVDALALLRSGAKVDLLLHDLLNSPVDGIKLLETARQEFPDLPVVIVTAVHDIDVALAAYRLGASDFLLKPFEREQLLVIVRQVLASRSQQQPTIMPWEEGLPALFAPAVENQLVVRAVDGTPKLICDLSPGDVVPVERDGKIQTLHLMERDGKLGAIESAPIRRE
jgi:CheY-like chemotaxis protein